MTTFLALWAKKNEIANEYEKLSLDAAQWKDREIYSVTKVQSVYRGWKTRCKINRWQRAGRQIQRVFRGHQGRIRFKGIRTKKRNKQKVALYEYCASKIQKIFKGYFSRKYTHNFQARRAYIKRVVQASNDLQVQMQQHADKLVTQEEKRLMEEKEKEFAMVTANLHHLLSTSTTPGIFNSPYSDPITANGISIEQHLKNATKQVISNKLREDKKRDRKEEGDTSPVKKNRNKASLQASSKYDIFLEEERKEMKFKKLKRLTKKDFIAGSIIGGIGSTYEKSILSGTLFVERYKAAQSTKEINDKVKTHRIVDKPFIASLPSGGRLFDE